MQHNYLLFENEQKVNSKNAEISDGEPDISDCNKEIAKDKLLSDPVSDTCIQRIMQFCRNIEIRNHNGKSLEWFNS